MEIGARVTLSELGLKEYANTTGNPQTTAVSGTVVSDDGDGWWAVAWDGGIKNNYRKGGA